MAAFHNSKNIKVVRIRELTDLQHKEELFFRFYHLVQLAYVLVTQIFHSIDFGLHPGKVFLYMK